MKQNTPGHKVKEIYAFIAVDKDGDEGICAFNDGSTWMPMIGSDFKRVESLKQLAKKLAQDSGSRIELVKFKTKKIVEYIEFEE